MIVLDTHVWLWWLDRPAKLSDAARSAIDGAERVGIPTICCWEVAMLSARGRVQLDRDVRAWIAQALAVDRAAPVPLDHRTAADAALLDDADAPADPADRIILATARRHGARLVTRDERLRHCDPALTVW